MELSDAQPVASHVIAPGARVSAWLKVSIERTPSKSSIRGRGWSSKTNSNKKKTVGSSSGL